MLKGYCNKFHAGFSSFYPRLFNPLNLYIVLVIYGLFYLASLYHRFIQIDENWFGEQAYWLVNEGVVKLKSMPGILDFDRHMVLYHKLLVWMGAVVVKTAGWSVYYFKLLTLAFYLLFFYVYWLFYRKNKKLFTYRQYMLAVTLLVLIPIMLQQSFIFRPEVYVMTLGFLSYYFLDHFVNNNKVSNLLWAAVFAGLTFLVTLNALIFPIAGFVLLLFSRKYKGLLIYSLVCGLVCLIFTVDLWKGDHWQVFLYQMNNWPTRKFGETYMAGGISSFFLTKLSTLLNEHQRFFWSDRVMAFSALFLVSYIFNFNYLRRNYRSLFIFTTTLILALNLTGSHIAERYLIFYYPFMALISSMAMLNKERANLRYLQYIFVLLLFVNLISLGKQFSFVFRQNENATAIHKDLLSKIPDNTANIFAPWKFIFNEIADYHVISYQALQYYQDDLPEKLDQAAFLTLLREKYKVKYMILDKDITRDEEHDYDWLRGGVATGNAEVRLLYTSDKYTVFSID